MKSFRQACFVLMAVSFSAVAATVEMPVLAKFKGTALDKSPISGYVVFGTLPDGSAAIQRAGKTLARYYERSTLFAPSAIDDFYVAMELDCKSGTVQVLGVGPLERITTLDDPPAPTKVVDGHPKNLPVYRRVCAAIGADPSW